MYEYLRNITSKLLVNENKLSVRESLEIGECPDIFLIDYFFLTYVRHSFVDFMFLVFRSLSKIAFFWGTNRTIWSNAWNTIRLLRMVC